MLVKITIVKLMSNIFTKNFIYCTISLIRLEHQTLFLSFQGVAKKKGVILMTKRETSFFIIVLLLLFIVITLLYK